MIKATYSIIDADYQSQRHEVLVETHDDVMRWYSFFLKNDQVFSVYVSHVEDV